MSIADKLITIANNTTLVCANLSTTETAKGNPITVGDVSDIEHNLGLRVTSKNLIPFPYLQSTKELNGITVIVNDDGTISASGTATADTTIYFDLCVKDFGTTNMYSGFAYDNGYAVKDCTYDAGNKKTYISISVKNGEEINNTYYPQIELGSTATSYTPYRTEFEGVEVSRYGKNLFDYTNLGTKYSGLAETTLEENILKVEHNLNYSTNYASANYTIPHIKDLAGKTITISAQAKTGTDVGQAMIRILFVKPNGSAIGGYTDIYCSTKSTEFTTITATGVIKADIPEEDCELCVLFYSNAGGSVSTSGVSYYKDIQIEINDTATEYEPYQEPQTATANTDGTVEGLTSVSPNMTLLADNSVSIECSYKSGGNPTANEKFIELQEAFANAKEVIQNQIGGGQDVMA